MIKSLKIVCIFFLSFIIMISTTSCDIPYSSYQARNIVRSTTSEGYKIRFDSLKGVVSQKMLRAKYDSTILYYASLEEGEINVYLYTPTDRTKTLMLNIKAGEVIQGRFGFVEKNDSATIIIETVSKSKGKFTFKYEEK